jgi:hypothetical protein
MNSGPNTSRRAQLLAAWLVAGKLFAAEDSPATITRDSLPPPPMAVASVAENPAVTDAGSPRSANTVKATDLPPLPPGVTELKFSEFFRQPVGPRGAEFTDKIRGLDGKRVRIVGYMVRQSQPVARCFLLTPRPLTLHEEEWGFAEDLPAAVLHVFTDRTAPALTPFTPGLLLLTGTLSIGNRAELDGRVSCVRLQLDEPTPKQRRVLKESGRDTERKTSSPKHEVNPSPGPSQEGS